MPRRSFPLGTRVASDGVQERPECGYRIPQAMRKTFFMACVRMTTDVALRT